MLRVISSLIILISAVSCSKTELIAPPEEIIKAEDTPSTPTPTYNTYELPYPSVLNPSGENRLVRIESGNIWYGSRVVDTTIYQYNVQGIVEKEYFTSKISASPSFKYIVKTFTVNPLFLGSDEYPYVTEDILYPTGRNLQLNYYCDENGRVNRKENSENNVKEYYSYDNVGRLSEVFQYWHPYQSYTKRYMYYTKVDSELKNDYYTEILYSGKWEEGKSPIETTEYFYSNQIKNRIDIRYAFNYGHAMSDSVVERIVQKPSNTSDDAFNRNFTFEFNNEGNLQKSQFLYRDNSFYQIYFYQ